MSDPICRAQSQVSPNQLKRIQSQAEEAFTEARPVLDSELLNTMEWQRRAEAVHKFVGLDLDAAGMASRIMNKMDTKEMPQFRTYTNVFRLIKSRRINDTQLAEWLELSLNDGKLAAFRDRSKQIFLGAKLFYYEFVPNQGTAWCYMPAK
jgi:hypothetical protein